MRQIAEENGNIYFPKYDNKDDDKEDKGGEYQPEPFDKKVKHMDLSNLKSTDLKINGSVIIPDPVSENKEMILSDFKQKFMEGVDKYKKNNQGEKEPKLSNLTKQQISGIKSIKTLGEVRVLETDKSKKIVIMSEDRFIEDLDKHIKEGGDKEITEKERKRLAKINNGVIKSAQRFLFAGANSHNMNQTTRIATSLTSTNQEGAKISLTIKDHKPRDAQGHMKTRPIFNCRDSISEKGSEFLSDILDMLHEDPDNINVKSTEEVQAKIIGLNKKLEENGNSLNEKVVIGSQDAKALYLSLIHI